MDSPRTWELLRPTLERSHQLLAPALPGHMGGPALSGPVDAAVMPDAVERAMDDAGIATAHIAGNSLGGFVALQLAARGRARSVVALAPAGGWADARQPRAVVELQRRLHESVRASGTYADAIAATAEGRRRATQLVTVRYEHLPTELVADMIAAVAQCDAEPLLDYAATSVWDLDAKAIECPVRICWGTEDRLLPWPAAAVRFENDLLPHADWVELADVGHAPQLDVPLETAELIAGFTGR